VVDVSPDGLLTAVRENACATITWSVTSTKPSVIALAPGVSCQGELVACVDAAGVDTATRATWLPVGDLDANVPGLPSGPPIPGIGGTFGYTILVSTGTSGIGAYACQINFDETVIAMNRATDTSGVGGCSQPSLSLPFAVGGGGERWNDVDAFATHAGYFDLSTVNFDVLAAGTSHIVVWNEELADGWACTIWVSNPCMPFNSTVCGPIPLGGYPPIGTVAELVIP
jgi:hypothetical protein